MKVSIVVAVASNLTIGKNNDLVWHLPRDLAYFKRITLGHHLLMGSNTFKALGKPLPRRRHIVVSSGGSVGYEEVSVVQSVRQGIELARQRGETELFVTGGGQIYRYCLEQGLIDKCYITRIHQDFEGDTQFLGFEPSRWNLIGKVDYSADQDNAQAMSFEHYAKKMA
ncbi:MAG: dihydrofolate reductase [Bacteroidetes bacterium]|nr:dihydrofolate reductase [Bacteroidota bacterium]